MLGYICLVLFFIHLDNKSDCLLSKIRLKNKLFFNCFYLSAVFICKFNNSSRKKSRTGIASDM